MKMSLMIGGLVAFLAASATALPFDYGWEDGATVLDIHPEDTSMLVSVVSDPVHGGTQSLELVDNADSGTPQAWVAYVWGLRDGDEVTVGFWRYDDTPGTSPSCRIWAHWNDELPGNPEANNGSASGNDDYGLGLGWDYTDYTWSVSGHTGIVIEARTYSEAGHTAWIDDLHIEVPDHASVQTPEVVAVQSLSWSAIKARGLR